MIKVNATNGELFELKATNEPLARDNMTNTKFDEIMTKGLMQAKADESEDVQEVFADFRKRVNH